MQSVGTVVRKLLSEFDRRSAVVVFVNAKKVETSITLTLNLSQSMAIEGFSYLKTWLQMLAYSSYGHVAEAVAEATCLAQLC